MRKIIAFIFWWGTEIIGDILCSPIIPLIFIACCFSRDLRKKIHNFIFTVKITEPSVGLRSNNWKVEKNMTSEPSVPMSKNLTIRKTYTEAEVMEWLNECNVVGIEPDMARQLLAAMQHEAKLNEALRRVAHACQSLSEAEIVAMDVLRSEYSNE